MKFSAQRKGEFAAGGAALLWSFFPILTVLTVSSMPPLFTAAVSTAIAACFFTALVILRGHWRMFFETSVWKDILLATLFIGIIYYGLLFIGYRSTTAGDGAIITLTEAFFTFIIVNLLWRHEPLIPRHALGAFCMVMGAFLVLLKGMSGQWNIGNLFILVACVFSPIGNIYAQRARTKVSTEVILCVRSILSALFLFLLSLFTEHFSPHTFPPHFLLFIILNGIFLLGLSKILWLEAIHRLPIAKTVALSEGEVFLTLIFAFLLLGQPMMPYQLFALVPMGLGLFLLTKGADVPA